MMLKEIGKRVRSARLEKRMTQAQLAAALDISVPYISHIEQGRQAMSVVVLQALCDELAVSADWILRNNSPESRKIADGEIALLLEDCTVAEKAAMLTMLKAMKEAIRGVASADK